MTHLYRWLYGFATIAMLCSAIHIEGANPILIDSTYQYTYVTRQASHLEDKAGTLTPEQAMSQPFEPCPDGTPNYGFSNSVHWLKIDLKNQMDHPSMVVFDLRNHYLEQVEIYWVSDSIKPLQKGGSIVKKIYPDAVTIAPKQEASLLLRIKSRTPLRVPVFIRSNENYWKFYGSNMLQNGIYYGIFALLIVLSIYLLISYRDRIYLTFGLCAASLLYLITGIDNTLPIMSHWQTPAVFLKGSTVAAAFAGILYIHYSKQFFNTRIKWITKLLDASMVVMGAMAVTYFFDYHFANKISYLVMPLTFASIAIVSAVLFFIKKIKFVRLHLLGTAILLTGTCLHMASNIGYIGNYWILQLSFKTGYMGLMTVFTLALLDKYILTQSNIQNMLQRKVWERTKELTASNQSLHHNISKLNEANTQLSLYKDNLEKVVEERTEALISTLSSLQSLIDSSPVAIFDIESDNRISSVWNPAATQIFGWTREEALGRTLDELNLNFWQSNPEAKGQTANGIAPPYFESQLMSRHGQTVELGVDVAPILSANQPNERAIVMMNNISEQKALLLEIQTNELKFRTLFESISLGILVLSPHMDIIEHNPAIDKMFKYDNGHLKGKELYSLFRETFHKKISTAQNQLIQEGVLPRFEFDTFDANRQPISVEVWGSFMQLHNDQLILVVVKDITEQKRFNQKLVETILETEEKERRRFAGDLHDELGPQLASMRIYASSLKKRAQSQDEKDILDTLMDLIKRTVDNVRELSNNLSPHLLDNYGLISAISMEAERKAHAFQTRFTHNMDQKRIEKNTEINIYRIVKELFNNSMKYAQASEVTVEMTLTDDRFELAYHDNGKGFDYPQLMDQGSKGLGLMNIKSRVDSLGGECHFKSKEGDGFSFGMTLNVNETSILPN